MSSLSRWNPIWSLQRLGPLVDFDDFFQGAFPGSMLRDVQASPEIRIDINEDEKNYFVSAEIPGVKKEDIDVSIDGNRVTVQAEVKRGQTREGEKEFYSERYLGKSYRAFSVPQEIDGDKCQARYDDGILHLTLPKKPNGQSKRLSIS